MFKHQYKELTYAEEILANGFTSKHIKHELKILVKYYKEKGHKPKERKELIYKFCEENLEGYNRVLHFKMINSVLNYGTTKRNILVEIENVSVTKSEVTYIDNLGVPHDYKKIIFTLLVLDKLNKKFHSIRNEAISIEHYFGGTKNYKELVSTSKVTLKKNNLIHTIIGELDKDEIVKITGNASIKLSFLYEIPEDDEVVITVSTFNNIGFYYDLHTGENKVKACEDCGIPIKATNNKSKYCEPCAKENEKENHKIRQKKYMKRKNDEIENH